METKNKNSKKILSLGIILLIVAGIIVVLLKGFNVSLMFGKHETIEIKIGKAVDLNIANEVCSEVFGKQKYVLKGLEVFDDSFQVNVRSITDEEKYNFVEKANEKFEVQKTVDDLNVDSISNKRLRDIVKLYIKPILVVFVITIIYMSIRFRKINSLKLIGDILVKIILTEAILLSIIAISRIPVTELIINILVMLSVLELIFFMYKCEKKLQIENNKN